jgi:hypothetical protein
MIRRALLLLALVACDAHGSAAPAITIAASVRGNALELEVAADPDTRERGLMFRRQLAEGTGMLFAFPAQEPRSFWMRNTYVPLSIAFLDEQGRIESIDDMEAFDEAPHASADPGRYAIEVPRGWLTAHGVGPGDVVAFALPTGLRVR